MDRVNGTLIWYYNICKREVWLMGHGIVPDQEDINIEIGRFIHETSYKRDEKEILFGNVRFDVLFSKGNKIIIGETKKSTKFKEASKMQLLYYLKVLEEAGIEADGVINYPEERKKFNINLDESTREELDNVIEKIEEILDLDKAPKVEKCKYCAKCGYKEYCYS